MAGKNGNAPDVRLCWCGCGEPVAEGMDFRHGHDTKAALAAIMIDYGSVKNFVEAHGYDPETYSLMVTYHQEEARRIGLRERPRRPATVQTVGSKRRR